MVHPGLSRSIIISAVTLLFTALGITQSAPVQNSPPPDWYNPLSINPVEPGICDFLDADIMNYYYGADLSYKNKNYTQAAQYFLAILRHRYDDYQTLYSLACCYGLLNEPELAAETLIRAVNSGYTNIEYIKKDKDFNNVRKHPLFQEAMKRIEAWRTGLGNIMYIKSVQLSRCYIQIPENYNKKKSYPLVIGLHGNGGNGDSFIRLWDYLETHDFIFAAPEGSYPKRLNSLNRHNMYSWFPETRDKSLWEQGDPITIEYINQIADEIGKQYSISRIYLLGFSQGAGCTYMTGFLNPDKYAGIICIGGSIPDTGKPWSMFTEDDMKNAKHLPVCIAHSRQDQAAPYLKGVTSKDRLQKLGYDVTFFDYSGGHIITPEVFRRIGEWINKH